MKNHRGYTLLELLFSVAIVGILLTLAIPYWQSFRSQHQLETQTNRLLDNIQFARNTAISIQSRVSICPSDDGRTCVLSSENGWIVFINKANDNSSDSVIRHYLLTNGSKIMWNGLGNNNYLQFNPQGNAQGYNGNFVNIIFDKKTPIQKTIIVSPTGRARLA